jgi:hypothetical protein
MQAGGGVLRCNGVQKMRNVLKLESTESPGCRDGDGDPLARPRRMADDGRKRRMEETARRRESF